MLSATQAYLCSTFKTWAGLEELDGVAVNLPKLPKNSNTTEVKEEYLFTQIGKFVDEFVLVEFDVERAWMEARNESGRTSSGLPGSQANPLAETTSLPTGGRYQFCTPKSSTQPLYRNNIITYCNLQ
ncbi:PREDICTED: uncharacterized protein LOC107345296 isoform X5 [Acropora digitifera]|uniref:uncharacterized protein LOC107345296 isoform X5 n=1 Tax=Acropora digitifera TaxID=70779 RepID=UPI000779F852|nr:PREDICTED: uncharacterized protein LOC107345296 isoform X5 [Acropora digitifera]